MERNFSFTDANHNLVSIECEITYRNGYKEFTIHGEYGNGCGQIDEQFEPKNEYQEKLLEFWKQYHLKDITNVENFEEELNNLIDVIEQIENEENERKVTENDYELFVDLFNEPEKAHVLALLFGLSINEIEDIEQSNYNDNLWTVQGIEYLFGTDNEMDVEWDEYLNNYIDEYVLSEIPNSLQFYFDDDRWKEDQKNGGSRGDDLNRYNGEELEYTLDGETYYAYRQ